MRPSTNEVGGATMQSFNIRKDPMLSEVSGKKQDTHYMIQCITLKNGCSMYISFTGFTHHSPVHQSSLAPSTTATGPTTLHTLSSPDTYPSHQTTNLTVKSESPTLMNTDQPLSENVS